MAKQKFRITNWRNYNKALIHRDSITFWLDDEAIQACAACVPFWWLMLVLSCESPLVESLPT
ncbi:hypothetical protein CE137_03870 [Salmonella enterica subsp. enterica serovar Waycross]|uniref:Transposase n=1 Tax=Salmonella enterica subsp. enterica serovar Senftenberg str. A4-543 TaxID=913082 RepID=G5R5E1_SALSE|nr:hypothetical protein CE137_03870 [Salmonella enterica subsp. enterica serovar Waycross]EHC82721.1 Transposase [Salmonella enterica subsp. enterica serovar Senftenberg str. A4-543]